MLRSSFSGFNIARLGLMASQNAMEVTGQNITNVKTTGYTRQRLEQSSLTGSTNMYNRIPDAHIGFGVSVRTVSQIRDPYVDTRYRLQMANLGDFDKKLSILKELESHLDEIGGGKDALAAQLSEFHSSLQALQSSPGDVTLDNAVRGAAKSITEYLNLYSGQLSEMRSQTQSNLEGDVDSVNDLLSQIQKLNISIMNSQANGLPALELQDERNKLLDELSTYVKINVSYKTDISPSGATIDTMTLNMTLKDGTTKKLLEGTDEPAKFRLDTDPPQNPPVKPLPTGLPLSIKLTPGDPNAAEETIPADNLAGGSFKSNLAMLNENGTHDGTTTYGIGFYEKSLNEFARVFAETFNKLNNLDGVPNGNLQGKDLFESNDPQKGITAATIRISDGWLKGTTRITCGSVKDAPAGDNGNVLKMITALTGKQKFQNANNQTVFEGSFQECLEDFRNILANDTKTTESTMKNYLTIVQDIGAIREGISGVNLDEETATMMQLNKAFTASSRLMTTLDDMLNSVLGMGITK